MSVGADVGFGNAWTFAQIYQVWNEMPLVIEAERRGKGEGIKEKKATEMKEQVAKVKEVKTFWNSINLRRPKTQAEIKTLYRQLGSFLAASTFWARTPWIRPAEIQDTKKEMRFCATSDERATLSLSPFKDLPGVYDKLFAQLGERNIVDIQMANCDLWWVAVVPPAEAEKTYCKLGYSKGGCQLHATLHARGRADRGELVALGAGAYPCSWSTM